MSYFVSTRTLSNQFNISNSHIQAYYRTLKYTAIDQDPVWRILDLIAYIGGIIGLFLGGSFLSFFEIFEILNDVIFIFIDSLVGNTI